jgi:hypothetical protein
MAAVSDTRSVDIEDDIKRRRPPIHPPICIRLVLRPVGRGIELHAGGGARALVEPARRWRSPRTGGSVSTVEEPTRRWSRATGGGSRSSVEEPVRRWSPFTGGGVHTPVEPRAGGRARSLLLEQLAAGGCRWRWRRTLARRRPIYRLDWD